MSILKIHTLVPNNKVQIQQKPTQAKRNAQITITLPSTEQVGEKKKSERVYQFWTTQLTIGEHIFFESNRWHIYETWHKASLHRFLGTFMTQITLSNLWEIRLEINNKRINCLLQNRNALQSDTCEMKKNHNWILKYLEMNNNDNTIQQILWVLDGNV